MPTESSFKITPPPVPASARTRAHSGEFLKTSKSSHKKNPYSDAELLATGPLRVAPGDDALLDTVIDTDDLVEVSETEVTHMGAMAEASNIAASFHDLIIDPQKREQHIKALDKKIASLKNFPHVQGDEREIARRLVEDRYKGISLKGYEAAKQARAKEVLDSEKELKSLLLDRLFYTRHPDAASEIRARLHTLDSQRALYQKEDRPTEGIDEKMSNLHRLESLLSRNKNQEPVTPPPDYTLLPFEELSDTDFPLHKLEKHRQTINKVSSAPETIQPVKTSAEIKARQAALHAETQEGERLNREDALLVKYKKGEAKKETKKAALIVEFTSKLTKAEKDRDAAAATLKNGATSPWNVLKRTLGTLVGKPNPDKEAYERKVAEYEAIRDALASIKTGSRIIPRILTGSGAGVSSSLKEDVRREKARSPQEKALDDVRKNQAVARDLPTMLLTRHDMAGELISPKKIKETTEELAWFTEADPDNLKGSAYDGFQKDIRSIAETWMVSQHLQKAEVKRVLSTEQEANFSTLKHSVERAVDLLKADSVVNENKEAATTLRVIQGIVGGTSPAEITQRVVENCRAAFLLQNTKMDSIPMLKLVDDYTGRLSELQRQLELRGEARGALQSIIRNLQASRESLTRKPLSSPIEEDTGPEISLSEEPEAEVDASLIQDEIKRDAAVAEERSIQENQATIQGEIDDLVEAYHNKYGGDLSRVTRDRETVGESFRTWKKDLSIKEGSKTKAWFLREYEELSLALVAARRAPDAPKPIVGSQESPQDVERSALAQTTQEAIELAQKMTGQEKISDADVTRAELELRAQRLLEDDKRLAVDSTLSFVLGRDPVTGKALNRSKIVEELQDARTALNPFLFGPQSTQALSTVSYDAFVVAERAIQQTLLLAEARTAKPTSKEKIQEMHILQNTIVGRMEALIQKAYKSSDTPRGEREKINAALEAVRVGVHAETTEEASKKVSALVEAYARVSSLVTQPGRKQNTDQDLRIQADIAKRLEHSIIGIADILKMSKLDMLTIKGGLKVVGPKI